MRSLAVLAMIWVSGIAWAQADPAADHYRAGVTHFKAGRYSEAIQEFEAADALRPSAVLSFNIAQCYEKEADLQSAKTAYQEYLRRAPNADDKGAIEATIASIDQKLSEKRESSQAVVLVPATPATWAALGGLWKFDGTEVKATGPPSGPNYVPGIVVASVGVAGLTAAIVLNALSHQNSQSLQNNALNGGFSASQENGFYSNAQNEWTGALIGYIAGGVVTAVGAGFLGYQYFTRPATPAIQ